MDDLISRQDAFDVIDKIFPADPKRNDYTQGITCGAALAKEYIKQLPSAQQWIPCSERLPKELVPVNVTWVNKDPEPYYLMIKDKPFTDTAVYYEGKWYWQSVTCVDLLKEYGESPADDVAYGIEIVAWMPLPEPYKGESE